MMQLFYLHTANQYTFGLVQNNPTNQHITYLTTLAIGNIYVEDLHFLLLLIRDCTEFSVI